MILKLDQYEQDIEDNFEKQSKISNHEFYISKLQQAAANHQKNKKSITIAIPDHDLEVIKIKASKKGISYQTYINMIIHKAATRL